MSNHQNMLPVDLQTCVKVKVIVLSKIFSLKNWEVPFVMNSLVLGYLNAGALHVGYEFSVIIFLLILS